MGQGGREWVPHKNSLSDCFPLSVQACLYHVTFPPLGTQSPKSGRQRSDFPSKRGAERRLPRGTQTFWPWLRSEGA